MKEERTLETGEPGQEPSVQGSGGGHLIKHSRGCASWW